MSPRPRLLEPSRLEPVQVDLRRVVLWGIALWVAALAVGAVLGATGTLERDVARDVVAVAGAGIVLGGAALLWERRNRR